MGHNAHLSEQLQKLFSIFLALKWQWQQIKMSVCMNFLCLVEDYLTYDLKKQKKTSYVQISAIRQQL